MLEPGHTPADFAAILSAREQPLVVGGQAVNIWAELRMLIELVPYFLEDQVVEVRAGRIPETQLLGTIGYLADLLRLPWVGNAVRAHSLDLRSLFPAWLRDACPERVRTAIEAISFPDS